MIKHLAEIRSGEKVLKHWSLCSKAISRFTCKELHFSSVEIVKTMTAIVVHTIVYAIAFLLLVLQNSNYLVLTSSKGIILIRLAFEFGNDLN